MLNNMKNLKHIIINIFVEHAYNPYEINGLDLLNVGIILNAFDETIYIQTFF